MKATLKFPKRIQAELFAKEYSRFSLMGHTITSGLKNVEVIVYNINKESKKWIDNYVKEFNWLQENKDFL